jgi:hypothetical protein
MGYGEKMIKWFIKWNCKCGCRPIFKRIPGGPELKIEFIYECSCGERGINAPTKDGALYGWVRRNQLRDLINWKFSA